MNYFFKKFLTLIYWFSNLKILTKKLGNDLRTELGPSDLAQVVRSKCHVIHACLTEFERNSSQFETLYFSEEKTSKNTSVPPIKNFERRLIFYQKLIDNSLTWKNFKFDWLRQTPTQTFIREINLRKWSQDEIIEILSVQYQRSWTLEFEIIFIRFYRIKHKFWKVFQHFSWQKEIPFFGPSLFCDKNFSAISDFRNLKGCVLSYLALSN